MPVDDGTPPALLNLTLKTFRRQMAQHMPRHFKADYLDAFARGILSTYDDPPIKALVETSYMSEEELIEWTQRYVLDTWRSYAYQWIFEQDPDARPVDGRAHHAVCKWLNRSARNEVDEREVIADFSQSTAELDATDDALRSRSTDFGNFVADAVKAGSGADLALINAGSLRADDRVPAVITVGQLLDVLLYDGPQAAMLVEIARREARALLAHGLSKVNHGAFLQVSEGFGPVLDGPDDGVLKVALVRFMLASPHDEDGFCNALRHPGESVEDTRRRQLGAETATASLLEWIRRGAAGVRYSMAPRVAADTVSTDIEADRALFIEMVDAYRDCCAHLGVQGLNMYKHLNDTDLRQKLGDGLRRFLDFIEMGYRKGIPAKSPGSLRCTTRYATPRKTIAIGARTNGTPFSITGTCRSASNCSIVIVRTRSSGTVKQRNKPRPDLSWQGSGPVVPRCHVFDLRLIIEEAGE